jgi:hypothetical protein
MMFLLSLHLFIKQSGLPDTGELSPQDSECISEPVEQSDYYTNTVEAFGKWRNESV